ncbi:putative peptide/nitrate transporter isoform X3 [Cinnamomum micranthum f. kanehirae]|uniref:Putative peptide/nitrate transporter isoform X3 n=1 Tax=Cinnamomum micranthum f. kanehirae TaxID=337451 RepID=A0A443NBP3_9MAGN|nr:putative peptide/nitrate transporter isoform X3 [Cinnamomum micranthum f. kanehirae]
MAADREENLLLEKVYYENCPGCRQDRIKENKPGIPFKAFFFVWAVQLCTALPISSLFPFVYFMIRDFHIAKTEHDIGYYAGFLAASFMIGRALTSILWGIAADRYGRKPIILLCTISVLVLPRKCMVIFNTLFGLSTSFWMAISMRFLLGCFNGLVGPIKAYATEICRKEYQPLALSIISTARGLSYIIGPVIGGFLAQPAEKYPSVFSKNSLFGRFPYLLPCVCVSLFALGVTIASLWFPETLHMHNMKGREEFSSYDASNSDMKESVEGTEGCESASEGSLLKNWPLMSSITVYCIFALHDMAYAEIFSLWAVSPRKDGGLSFSSKDVGVVLAISGLGLILFQLFVYPVVEKSFGPIMVSRIAAFMSVLLLSSYPIISMLSGLGLSIILTSASMLKNILSVMIITGMFILQNNAVPQNQRGAANGISATAMSIFRAIGPAGGGALFSWSQKRQNAAFLPGDQMVFFVLNVVELIGALLTFKPFLDLPDRQV